MEITNQKEYLKKYLSGGGKEGKRRKKKKRINGDRVTIIDDDIDFSQIHTTEEALDLLQTNEDAPQVVGVIDERPMHLRVKDYTDSNLWKPVGEQANSTEVGTLASLETSSTKNFSSLISFKQLSVQKDNKHNIDKSNQNHLKRNIKSEDTLGDQSPPRRNQRIADSSPPRRQQKDSSPPRRQQKDSSSLRCQHKDSSPLRRQQKDNSPPRRQQKDNSPPRKVQKTVDSNLLQKTNKQSDSSPPCRFNSEREHSRRSLVTDISPVHHRKDCDSSPPRKRRPPEVTEVKRKLLPGDKRGKYLIPAKRMTKTLDGKTAGLQNAHDLVKETRDFREREDNLFKNMDASISGANATTVVRDRKTGKIRDFAQDAEERREKEKQEEETKEKYMQWGKGLKQVEDYNDKLAQDLHEMNKPLARYADDEDLERYLKERDRDEDPMLAYIKRKRKKKDVEVGKPSKPEYMGEFMPNRYCIVPGHRWDGVDRSNGYEQKWVEKQNARLAVQEDIYKWSTEDM